MCQRAWQCHRGHGCYTRCQSVRGAIWKKVVGCTSIHTNKQPWTACTSIHIQDAGSPEFPEFLRAEVTRARHVHRDWCKGLVSRLGAMLRRNKDMVRRSATGAMMLTGRKLAASTSCSPHGTGSCGGGALQLPSPVCNRFLVSPRPSRQVQATCGSVLWLLPGVLDLLPATSPLHPPSHHFTSPLFNERDGKGTCLCSLCHAPAREGWTLVRPGP